MNKRIARLGFEPRLSESESLVLPLHYQALVSASHNLTKFANNSSARTVGIKFGSLWVGFYKYWGRIYHR